MSQVIIYSGDEILMQQVQSLLSEQSLDSFIPDSEEILFRVLSQPQTQLAILDSQLPQKTGKEAKSRSDNTASLIKQIRLNQTDEDLTLFFIAGDEIDLASLVVLKQQLSIQEIFQKPLELQHLRNALRNYINTSSDDTSDVTRPKQSLSIFSLGDTGVIENLLIPVLIQKAANEQRTGVLDVLGNDESKRRLFFSKGNPCFALSDDPLENLAALMVQKGIIKEPQYQMLLDKSEQQLIPLMDTILQSQIIDRKKITELQRELSLNIFLRTISVPEGHFAFTKLDAIDQQLASQTLSLNISQMIFHSLASMPSFSLQKTYFAEFFHFLVKTGSYGLNLEEEFERYFGNQTIFRSIDGSQKLEDLLKKKHLYPNVNKELAALIISKMASLDVMPLRKLKSVTAFENQREDESNLSPEDRRVRNKIREAHEIFMKQNYYDLFQFPPNDPGTNLRSAYARLAKEFHSDGYQRYNLGSCQKLLDEIFSKITEGFEVLSNPERKKSYDLELERQKQGLPTDVKTILESEKLYNAGKKFLSRRLFQEARKNFEDAINMNRGIPEYFIYYAKTIGATCNRDPQEINRAKQMVQDAMSKSAPTPFAFITLGELLLSLNQQDEALQYFKEALELEPNNTDAMRHVRILASRTGKPVPASPAPKKTTTSIKK